MLQINENTLKTFCKVTHISEDEKRQRFNPVLSKNRRSEPKLYEIITNHYTYKVIISRYNMCESVNVHFVLNHYKTSIEHVTVRRIKLKWD